VPAVGYRPACTSRPKGARKVGDTAGTAPKGGLALTAPGAAGPQTRPRGRHHRPAEGVAESSSARDRYLMAETRERGSGREASRARSGPSGRAERLTASPSPGTRLASAPALLHQQDGERRETTAMLRLLRRLLRAAPPRYISHQRAPSARILPFPRRAQSCTELSIVKFPRAPSPHAIHPPSCHDYVRAWPLADQRCASRRTRLDREEIIRQASAWDHAPGRVI
jgi:hypothetical protein